MWPKWASAIVACKYSMHFLRYFKVRLGAKCYRDQTSRKSRDTVRYIFVISCLDNWPVRTLGTSDREINHPSKAIKWYVLCQSKYQQFRI